MLGLQIIEVALGLLCLYVFSSVIVTSINQFVSTALKLRNRGLKKGIYDLLQNEPNRNHTLSFEISNHHSSFEIRKVIYSFFKQPLIRNLGDPNRIEKIPPRTFVLALFSYLHFDLNDFYAFKQNNITEDPLNTDKKDVAETIKHLIDLANCDTESALNNIEDWFNNTVTIYYHHWYAFWITTISIIFSFIFVASLNLDSIMIARELWINNITEKVVLNGVPCFKPDSSTGSITSYENAFAWKNLDLSLIHIYQNNLLIGWETDPDKCISPRAIPSNFIDWIYKSIGLMITTIAVSLGSNYWFDLIFKVLKANKGS